ncbi:MAG: IclR family transcriptional regulator [Roseiarcus sp.]|jgi:IclR family transcriptional regulator, acetate operon repressor
MSKIVARTLDLLELFGREKRPLSLSDIARLLSIPVSSCFDVLQALQSRGYIYELAPRAGYYPTLRLQQLGKEISDSDPVVSRAELLLRSMRDTLDESVLLAKVGGLQATYLLAFESAHPLRFQAKIGDRVRSLHATSGGKALLASLDDQSLAAYLKTARLEALTDRTITSKPALQAEIETGRARGWFANRGESLDEVTTISASFRWNASVYIVTVAGPSSRLDRKFDQAAAMLASVRQLLEMRANGS